MLDGNVGKWMTVEAGERELAVGVVTLMKAKPEKTAQLFRGAEGYKHIDTVTAHGMILGKDTEADLAK